MFQPIRCRQLIHCHSKVHWSYIWNCIFFQTINIIQFGCPNVLDWLGLPLPLSCFVSIFLKNLLLIWSWCYEDSDTFVWLTKPEPCMPIFLSQVLIEKSCICLVFFFRKVTSCVPIFASTSYDSSPKFQVWLRETQSHPIFMVPPLNVYCVFQVLHIDHCNLLIRTLVFNLALTKFAQCCLLRLELWCARNPRKGLQLLFLNFDITHL